MTGRETAAIVVAAGKGERFGKGDKVLLPLAGQPVLAHVLDAIELAESVQTVVIVAGSTCQSEIKAMIQSGRWPKARDVVIGGGRRQDSVAAGLHRLPATADLILIHDGARPLVTPDLIDRCAAAAGPDAVIAATPVTDTLKRVSSDGRILETVPREALWAAQTPQVYPPDRLATAMHHPAFRDQTYTDEAALFEALGWPVKVIPGDPNNMKITWPGDLLRAEALLAQIKSEAARVDRHL
ncbi:MAG TPA: 2-C-methyl-D-erythritol 4-phosphate cytidylyltransferase [Thermomicrobiales bacterium]|nr:2-C-methyl-D-erythritol 4-phosphate cytidylyltransferase [Thermomicrobiales bacterium]